MEYPFRELFKVGRLKSSGNVTLVEDSSAHITSNSVRIQGPRGKIIFVLTDAMNPSLRSGMRYGPQGGFLDLDTVTHRLRGGVSLHLGTATHNIMNLLTVGNPGHWQVCYRRWTEMFGNDYDFRVADFIATDTYQAWCKPNKRVKAVLDGVKAYGVGDPWVSDIEKSAPIPGDWRQHSAHMWTTAHLRTSGTTEQVAGGKHHYRIPRTDPVVMIGMACRFYVPGNQMTALYSHNSLGSIGLGYQIKSTAWAAGIDMFAQRSGCPDKVFWVGVAEDMGAAGEFHDKLNIGVNKLQSWNLTYDGVELMQTDSNDTYNWWDETYAELESWNTVSRVPTPVAERWLGYQMMSRKGDTTFGNFKYMAWYMPQDQQNRYVTGYNDVIDWKYGDIPKDMDNSSYFCMSQAVGKMTPQVENLNFGFYTELGGRNIKARAVVIRSPVGGKCLDFKWEQKPATTSTILEMPHASLPVTINPDSLQRVLMGFSGQRNRFGNRSGIGECLTYLGTDFAGETYAEKKDDETVTSVDIDGVLNFII